MKSYHPLVLYCILVYLCHANVHGLSAIVQWQAEKVAMYAHERQADVFLEISEPQGRNVIVGLLSFGIGLTISEDTQIPETATIPEGRYVGSVPVILNEEAINGDSENGYRKLRIRLNEVVKGKAELGGYGFNEIMDINILGHSTSTTGCRSGSFRSSRVIVNEGDGVINLPFIINEPLSKDFEIPYRVMLGWTGASHHATNDIDYRNPVQHNHEEEFKHVTLKAGETAINITFHLIDDNIPENTEQFLVHVDSSCMAPYITVLSDHVIVDIVDNDRCPDLPAGTQYYDGSCYFQVHLPGKPALKESEALDLCQEHEAHLAIIHSGVENTIVSTVGDFEEAWIGLKRAVDDFDTFVWYDNTILAFECWRQREPNNKLGNECCVKINYVRLGFWNDTPCETDKRVHLAVCEKPAHSHDIA